MSRTNSTKPERIVAYYRMSTSKQEASIPEQKAWVQRTIRLHPVELVAEFEDDAIAGDEIQRRPGLASMVAWCASHPVDAIIVWDADRLSRASSIRTAAVLDVLMQAGVTRLLTPDGWIDLEEDVDRVLFNIRQDLSRSAYSKGLSRNVTRSAIARARLGLWVAGRAPYGYQIGDDGHLALGDPAFVETVRWIFRQFASTAASCGDLCRQLIEMGAPPPPARQKKDRHFGGHWLRRMVNGILSNRVYLGDLCWNFSAHGKYHRVCEGEVTPVKGGRGRGKIQRNDPTDVIITPNAHPAIIDPDTFAACQKKLAQTRRGSPRCRSTPLPGGGEWVLSGLLYCGVCGGRMVGRIERRNYSGKPLIYRHYVCGSSWRKHAGGCHLNAVKQEAVVGEVAKLIQQSFTDPERLALLRAEVERLTSQEEGTRKPTGSA